jgi:starch synthase
MKTVFVSSEATPYASTGGLADVAAALPVALKGQGMQVCRVMPMYRRVIESTHAMRDTGWRLDVPVGLRTLTAEVWISEDEPVVTYFIRKDEFFDRRELYSLPDRDYDDNFERFVFFQKAVVALLDRLGLQADIVHANDWQTALIPYFLKYGIRGMGREQTEKTVFTVHNLAYQGIFPAETFPYTNLPFSVFSLAHVEYYGNINCMKGALVSADHITTVSKRYAQEILTPEYGCGLEGVLAGVKDNLTGILNGVDYRVWDPSRDHMIPANYSSKDLAGKQTCREHVLQRMGLGKQKDGDIPVIGMVSRLVDQKGFDLLAESMEAIMQHDVIFILLGSGREEYQALCRTWTATWPDRFAAVIGFDVELSHEIEAGADIFLMPSRFEPCGLNQLYSLKYGTVPLVYATGGLDDTIERVSKDADTGTGFKFDGYTSEALIAELERALSLYKNPAAWKALQLRGMEADFSWNQSAAAYIRLYESLTQTA